MGKKGSPSTSKDRLNRSIFTSRAAGANFSQATASESSPADRVLPSRRQPITPLGQVVCSKGPSDLLPDHVYIHAIQDLDAAPQLDRRGDGRITVAIAPQPEANLILYGIIRAIARKLPSGPGKQAQFFGNIDGRVAFWIVQPQGRSVYAGLFQPIRQCIAHETALWYLQPVLDRALIARRGFPLQQSYQQARISTWPEQLQIEQVVAYYG